MFELGKLMKRGGEGVSRDAVAVKELYARAIEEGADTDAMYLLGRLLGNGVDGVARDVVRGMSLFERAISEVEDVDAMSRLGEILMRGAEGVPQNVERGIALWKGRGRQENGSKGQQTYSAPFAAFVGEGLSAGLLSKRRSNARMQKLALGVRTARCVASRVWE